MGEERSVGEVPSEILNGKMSKRSAMKTQDMRHLLGDDLNTHVAVLEICHADHTRLSFPLRLLALLGREAIGDTDMPSYGIQTIHLRSEKATMRRAVLQLVDRNIIMNHLMEDDVFYHVLRQVYAGVDTQDKIGKMPLAAT